MEAALQAKYDRTSFSTKQPVINPLPSQLPLEHKQQLFRVNLSVIVRFKKKIVLYTAWKNKTNIGTDRNVYYLSICEHKDYTFRSH